MKILSPGITLFEDVYLQNEELIALADEGPWRDGVVGTQAKTDNTLRIADIHDLDPETVLHDEFAQLLIESIREYSNTYPINVNQIEGLRVAKYPEGGFYKPHIDAAKTERQLSALLFLNDDFEGGELYFDHLDLTIQPKAGSLLLFPSNFLFRHECKIITKGEKYIGLTWAM